MDHTVRERKRLLDEQFEVKHKKGNERSASPLKSPCRNERLSIFNRLFTTFLESELESVTQQFGS